MRLTYRICKTLSGFRLSADILRMSSDNLNKKGYTVPKYGDYAFPDASRKSRIERDEMKEVDEKLKQERMNNDRKKNKRKE